MRKLTRPESPVCLAAKASQWTERYLSQKTLFRWPNQKCYQEIRATLEQMTGTRCAYCGGPLQVESLSTVDHLRPKKSFKELAFTWSNLFASCNVCQRNKGETWCEIVLQPDLDGYDFSAYFIANFATGAVDPSPLASPHDQLRAQSTINFFGLNSDPRKTARLRELRAYQRREVPDSQAEDFNYLFFLEAAGS